MAIDMLTTYHTVVRDLGIVPEHSYARYDELTRFRFGGGSTARTGRVAPPKVGVKPAATKPRRRK